MNREAKNVLRIISLGSLLSLSLLFVGCSSEQDQIRKDNDAKSATPAVTKSEKKKLLDEEQIKRNNDAIQSASDAKKAEDKLGKSSKGEGFDANPVDAADAALRRVKANWDKNAAEEYEAPKSAKVGVRDQTIAPEVPQAPQNGKCSDGKPAYLLDENGKLRC